VSAHQTMPVSDALRHCGLVTRRCARNFYYGLKLTPEPQRSALFTLYAWMRRADDLVDDAESTSTQRLERIEDFRAATERALTGTGQDNDPLWIALADVALRFDLQRDALYLMLDGQIDDLVGVVEHIGPRSTRVRSPENRDIIVPNSSFLEKNVVNWTLSDDRYRTHIVVGVMYGSPVREVIRLIRKALHEHGKVLSKPEPIVLFADFGDSALSFEAHFWIRMRRLMDCRVIESDIRARVDALFREAGIVIAFPQQDVHLDSQSPIQVQLMQKRSANEATDLDTPSTQKGTVGPMVTIPRGV